MKQEKIASKLKGTIWTDTYYMCEAEIIGLNKEKTNNNDTYITVELKREKLDNKDMFIIDFIDFISLGRFSPRNNDALYVSDIVNVSSDFPTI